MKKEDFIKAIEECGITNYKIRYIKNGKYGKPEVWLYNKDNTKHQKTRYKNGNLFYLVSQKGNPIMESKPGLLIEEETIKDKNYLEEYIKSCF